MPKPMLDRYGGFSFLSRIVMDFYDRVLDSERLAPYFADVDMRRLIDHQTKFVAFLMGGPASYTNEQLRQVHARLGIDDTSFDEMVETFTSTLRDHGLTDRDAGSIAGELQVRRRYIVVSPAR